jgi:SM-20-related protein
MDIDQITRQLELVGYIVLPAPLPAALVPLLLARCQDENDLRFHAAQIGRGQAKRQFESLRGDVISWLDDSNSTDHRYLDWMEALRLGLNAGLFLGLFDFECHYAIYGAGAGYGKHSDVLQGKANRILSTVLYLNEDWLASDGGELKLFDPTGNTLIASVTPSLGTMIIFLSESFPHEVLMAHRTRRSIAGWFRVRE